ncbi:helix-turn-helix domain-containing protein [Blautia massiliensis (ex Liu et al. 2021)]|uniref:helix-turn-helix domain-containing protein n=1 Tax=Blautia massiliensis (ex Liu et al. 2021) TaxID=3062492 RepID=UPI003F8C0E3D
MIGEKLKEIRENLGLNKKEFAQYIGIKYTTYNGYETEAREPSSDFLILISEKFDVSIDYLLGLKDEREILHAYKLRSGEYEHIKKYRELDTHGKDMVDTVLQKEYDHIIELRDFAPQSKYIGKDPDNIVTVDLTPLAAHTRTDVEQTPEGVQHDLDIMNDDSQWE